MSIEATVYKKNGKPRRGKGFSKNELKEAGLTLKEALKLGIPVDKRRSSAYRENIEALKRFIEKVKAFAKKKEKAKKRKTETKSKKG
ncbi:hypothetical protein DRO54_01810 [Candidatus Bathyarchaeota archaeon]|nr:MAG: hypothetical protein DRO54_01810 [Candidatus Bathyarchaeota archaeon]